MCNKYLSGSWDFFVYWAVSCGQVLNAEVLLIILFLSLLCLLYLLLLLLVLEVRIVKFWWLLHFRKVDLLLFAWFYIIHFCWRLKLMQLWIVKLDKIGGWGWNLSCFYFKKQFIYKMRKKKHCWLVNDFLMYSA
jgi:hypothetical protein